MSAETMFFLGLFLCYWAVGAYAMLLVQRQWYNLLNARYPGVEPKRYLEELDYPIAIFMGLMGLVMVPIQWYMNWRYKRETARALAENRHTNGWGAFWPWQ